VWVQTEGPGVSARAEACGGEASRSGGGGVAAPVTSHKPAAMTAMQPNSSEAGPDGHETPARRWTRRESATAFPFPSLLSPDGPIRSDVHGHDAGGQTAPGRPVARSGTTYDATPGYRTNKGEMSDENNRSVYT
jgi:hypothetical protein